MRLMQTGDLNAATAAIQRGLGSHGATVRDRNDDRTARRQRDAIDAEFVVVDGSKDRERDVVGPRPRGGGFHAHAFHSDHGSLQYKLFIPPDRDTTGMPLVVMLHGCTQNPDDFARGTRMNKLAEEHGFVVAYPAQSASKNGNKCWNWFRRDDQGRGSGEPALLAALASSIVEKHRLDPTRTYVAGLSAGGAMAAVLGVTYPDVFAAIGVHSGLPFGVAHDMPSAFAAMKPLAKGRPSGPSLASEPIPAIVFHGDRDTMVDPCNGVAVVEQFTAPRATGDGRATRFESTLEEDGAAGGRKFTRTILADAASQVVVEHWTVHGAGHAWFGGDPSGSYTEPGGPDASAEMVRFFLSHVRRRPN